jgi:hypothetical protein
MTGIWEMGLGLRGAGSSNPCGDTVTVDWQGNNLEDQKPGKDRETFIDGLVEADVMRCLC